MSYSAASRAAPCASRIARVFVDAPLDLGAEVPQQALHRPGSAVAKGANGVTFDLLGHLHQHVDLALLRAALAMRVSTRHIQPMPSRHGVHWPQLSCL